MFAAVPHSSLCASSLIPFNAFVFLSFTNTSVGTPPQTLPQSFAPRFFLMRWCPVRNLTNTFPHNPCTNTASRAPTLRCTRASYPKQYNIVAREQSTKAPPNSMRDIIKVNTGKFRHLLTRFTLTRDVMRVTLTTKLFHEAFAPKQKHWPFFCSALGLVKRGCGTARNKRRQTGSRRLDAVNDRTRLNGYTTDEREASEKKMMLTNGPTTLCESFCEMNGSSRALLREREIERALLESDFAK